MRIIYGTIAGLLAGFIGATLLAPRSGKETRKNLDKSSSKYIKDLRMTYNRLANKVGLISDKKLADLNKKTVTAYNSKNSNGSTNARVGDAKTLEKVHERSAATKAVDSPTDKSHLRKVPVNTK